jgi:hypothetical protein
MPKEKYALLFIPSGVRLDINAENLAKATDLAIQTLFDLDKEYEVKELTFSNNEKMMYIEGIDNEDGKRLFVIVSSSKVADTIEEFKEFRKLN